MNDEIKSKYQLYEEIKKLCQHTYYPNTEVPAGWKLVHKHKNPETSFYGEIFQKGPYTVVAYKGSTDFKDWKDNNAKMYSNEEPPQVDDAYLLYMIAKGKNQLADIIVAGHSLGGSLAQIVSAKANVEAVTFNAYGTGGILKNIGLDKRKNYKIYNFGDLDDKVFNMNLDKQPGKTYMVNMNNLTEKEIRDVITEAYRKKSFFSKHLLKDIAPLDTSQETPQEIDIPYHYGKKKDTSEYLDTQSTTEYEQHIKSIREKIKLQEEQWRREQERKRRQAENDYINQMRSVAHQYGNMSIDIRTPSGRVEHIQSGYIPPQARPVSQQQFQIRGSSVQDVTQQIKNILNRYR